MSAPRAPLLRARGLVKRFPLPRPWPWSPRRWVHAVSGVDLDVYAGETLAIVGESGSGKSTLARLLVRAIPPTEGEVRLGDVDLARVSGRALRPLRRRVQLVFQDNGAALDPRRTVATSVAEGLRSQRLVASDAEARSAVERLLGQVGLPAAIADRYPHELSGGQRQRVGIARALAVSPELLVADEPVSALDASVRGQVLDLLAEVQRERGLALVLISHDLEVVASLADRIAVTYLGRVVEIGDRDAVLGAPAHPYTRSLLAAIPARRPAERGRRAPAPGEPPSPVDPPPGCAFHPRCPIAEAGRCAAAAPSLRTVDGGREVACHLVPAAERVDA